MNDIPIEVHTLSSSDDKNSDSDEVSDSDVELISLEVLLSLKKRKLSPGSGSHASEKLPRTKATDKRNLEKDVITLDDSSNSNHIDSAEISCFTPTTPSPVLNFQSLPSDSGLKFRAKQTLDNGILLCDDEYRNDDRLTTLTEINTKWKLEGKTSRSRTRSKLSFDNDSKVKEAALKHNLQFNEPKSERQKHSKHIIHSPIEDLNESKCIEIDKEFKHNENQDDIPKDLNVSLFSRCKTLTNSTEAVHEVCKSPELGDVQFIPPGCSLSSERSKPKRKNTEEETISKLCDDNQKSAENTQGSSLLTKLEEARQYSLRTENSGDFLKYLTVVIDERFIESPDGSKLDIIIGKLQNENYNINYEIREQPIANTITWSRVYQSDCESCPGNNMQWTDEDQVLVILQMKEFLLMIDAYKQKCRNKSFCDGTTLSEYTNSVHSCYQNMKITYVICSADKYFKQQKSKQNKDLKNNVLGLEPSQPKCKKKKQAKKVEIEVSEIDMEEVIVDLQLRFPDCNIHFSKNDTSEIADMVVRFSKAIAKAPYKLEKQKSQFSWCLDSDNRSCVRVDKSGKFLPELWMVQIQCFANVGADSSEAIVAEYPTPQSLLKAYHKSPSIKKAQLLLKNIMVRRQAGPFSTSRRIGPELSKKIHAFFTCKEGEKLLHNL